MDARATSWDLRDAVVGSPVVVRDGNYSSVRRIDHVKVAGKGKVVLADGSEWARSGRPWGSGREFYSRRHAALILDLDAVKREVHAERQALALEDMRADIRHRVDHEIKRLDGAACASIVAILDAAKVARESKERGEANP